MRFSAATDETDRGAEAPGSLLARRLFASIFLSFLGLGALLTGILVWDVVQRAEKEVAREMELLESAFHDPIADQLWAYDRKELDAILDAVVRISAVHGVAIQDAHSGQTIATRGQVDPAPGEEVTTHRFGIYYLPQGSSRPRHIGNAILHTRSDLALLRSWPSIALILTAATVKVGLIWFLFQFFARRQLVEPLARLTAAVDAIDPADGRALPVHAVGAEDGELTRLQDAFNRLLARLALAQAVRGEYERDLVAARDRLEGAVRERTRALEAERAKAEEANLAKSRFLAMMSHELRTPLNSILGFSRVMGEEVMGPLDNPKYREYTGDIQSSAQHLLAVISDILDISKIEAGEVSLDETEVDVADLAGTALRLVRPRLEAKGHSIAIDIPDERLRLRADERILRQVIVNLLTNSIKFTPQGGMVTIRGRLDDRGGVVLRVEDTGIGIAPEDIPRVLEAFGQARSSVGVSHEGTGLGLTLSKQLVELHGGELSIESEPGKGTTVSLRFPPYRTVS